LERAGPSFIIDREDDPEPRGVRIFVGHSYSDIPDHVVELLWVRSYGSREAMKLSIEPLSI
jgi:hypothetical protein